MPAETRAEAYDLSGVSPGDLIGSASALLHRVGEVDVAIGTGQPLGDALLLGRWQRSEDTLGGGFDGPVARRRTGGPACRIGEGLLYVGVALRHRSVLMETPKHRILNRTVRPLLAALRRLHFSAHYFGRDVVSVDRRPAGLIAWAYTEEGRVLFEAFLGLDRPFCPDARVRRVRSGKPPLDLRTARGAAVGADEVAAAVVEAFAEAGALSPARSNRLPAGAPTPADLSSADPGFCDARLRWSRPLPVPIGVVSAGLALDEEGCIARAAVAGDVYQEDLAPVRLNEALCGRPPSPELFRDALNATYGQGGVAIEGLSSLQPLLEAFLEIA